MNFQARISELSFAVLQNVRSAIVISDATSPDEPLVYVNPAFETLTGYTADEVIGRQCSFLQGNDRDQVARKAISAGLAAKRHVRAVLRNCRKDGSLFYNELFVDPIFDQDGTVTHFIGCQNSVPFEHEATVLQTAQVLYDRLTAREREVYELLSNGHSNRVIASRLAISPRTAEKHCLNVFKKFEVDNITLLVRYAIVLAVPLQSMQGGQDPSGK
jgi:PAS domain S-box-containing protein